MRWLFGRDELGVPRYLYVLFLIASGFAVLGNVLIILGVIR